MNVIEMIRNKMMKRPDIKRRKADVGDTIRFVLDSRGLSQYWPHTNHKAKVLAVKLQHQAHRPSPRAVYFVECECGVTLNPRATAFELVVA